MEHFLAVGPFLGTNYPGLEDEWAWYKFKSQISVQNLDLEILSPNVPEYQIAPEFYRGWQKRLVDTPNANYVVHPKNFARETTGIFRHLLSTNQHTAEYGGKLYYAIGKIRSLVNGEIHDSFDLAEELQKCKFDWSNGGSFYNNERDEWRPAVYGK